MDGMDAVDWKNKYETLEHLAIRALTEYDDLQKNYNENVVQYEELRLRLAQAESQLLKLQSVLGPACLEFNKLNENFEVEKCCRFEAEKVATKYYKQNKDLKRQSQQMARLIEEANLSVTQMGTITEDEAIAENNTEQEGPPTVKIFELEAKLKLLEEKLESSEKERLSSSGERTQQDILITALQDSLKEAQDKSANLESQMEAINAVSNLAWNDYEALREKYDRLIALNEEAVVYAHKMLSERDAVVRQSSVLLSSAAADQRLMRALQEIEVLTKQLKVTEDKHASQVLVLEQTLQASENATKVKELEDKLELASKELEVLQTSYTGLEKSYQEIEKWKQKLERENVALVDALDVAQQKLKPAPPPPPPPLPPPNILIRPFKLLMKKKDGPGPGSNVNRAGKPKDTAYEDAMTEMMERIKHGQTLKPAGTRVRPQLPEIKESTAMVELQNILKNMKKVNINAKEEPKLDDPVLKLV